MDTDIVIIEDNGDLVVREILRSIDMALEEIGFLAEGYVVGAAPTVTSNLKNNITHRVINDEKCVIVGTNVPYAKWVELGHSQEVGRFVPQIGKRLKKAHTDPHPFLVPTVQAHKKEYREILEKRLNGTK